jgi:hypothetical protein
VQGGAPDREAFSHLAVGDHDQRCVSRRRRRGKAGGIQARPLLRAPVPGAKEDRLDGRDRRSFDLDGGVRASRRRRRPATPLVVDVQAAREGDAAVAHQRLAVVAAQQRQNRGRQKR